ncbi:OmpH family outer membrane protein [uncultured Ruminobacter sp.]|jgi:outer membrane protein|uniref:OmpH family outer membrane protein n=1 Tax=Ruminobacter sp. TaxID=2774296 RepID=UPI0025E42F38|nr:OmpH family outer membrane protein [uncultured Ruminobacter sp.]
MLKSLSSLAIGVSLVLGTAAFTEAYADSKVATVSVPYVYSKIPQSKAAEDKVNKATASKAKALDKLQSEGAALQKALGDSKLSADERAKKQRELQLIETELQVKYSELREEQQKLMFKEKTEIDKKIQAAIDSVAKQNNVDVVIRAESLLYISNDSIDLSEKVIENVSRAK